MPKKQNQYSLEGKKIPSVTTILNVISKPALMYWYGKHGTKECQRLLKEAGSYGDMVHTITQNFLEGQRQKVTADQKIILKNLKSVTKGWQWEGFEVVLINKEYGYGGTCDGIATIDSKRTLVDFKTSKGVWPEFSLQMAAYEACETADGGKKLDIEQVRILHLDKETLSWSVLNIDTTDLFPIFLAAKDLYEWQQKNK